MDTRARTHVLILDPDPATRALLIAVVRRSRFEATACGTEEAAAKECARGARYAAVIVSADMPRADALLHELRLPPQGPRIILTTTAPTPLAALADTVLWKPFHLVDLEAAIVASCGLDLRDGGPQAVLEPPL